MTIATVGEGKPWAAAVFYASDGLDLYFLSDPASRHSRDIASNPAVAIAVHEDYHDWRKIKGLQMEADARLAAGEEDMARAVAVYSEKYAFTAPFLKLMASPFPRIMRHLDSILARAPFVSGLPATFNVKFYKVMPRRIRIIDNEKGFSHREEFTIGPAGEFRKTESI